MTSSDVFDRDGVTLTREQSGILKLVLNKGENLINAPMIELLSEALRIAREAPHPKALVVIGRGKFFCNGLDLAYLSKAGVAAFNRMIESFWKEVLAPLLVMNCFTVCAINGHAMGAGCFFSLACDFRLMRTERGFLTWPETNLGMRLSVGFSELTKAKVLPTVFRDVLKARRFTSSEAVAAGVVDLEVPEANLEKEATRLAETNLPTALGFVNFNPESLSTMKIELYTDAYRALTTGRIGAPPESPIGTAPAARAKL